MKDSELLITLVVMSTTVLLFVGGLAALLVTSHNRRARHRAEVAEMHLRHGREVMKAEREAIQHTLRDVGRELHDSAGQLLTVAQMGLNTLLTEHPADARIEAARDALDQGIEEVRRLGHTLNTDLWRERSLIDAIRSEADRIARLGRIQVAVEARPPVPVPPPDTSTILFRVFQETVNNTLKHSGAEHLTIALHGTSNGLRLTLTDDGRGFDPSQVKRNAGLGNIRDRCALVGYSATCTTAPGAGCTWTLEPTPTPDVQHRVGR
jgi:signal transduction histidine kinase